jgi:hypothetical protein
MKAIEIAEFEKNPTEKIKITISEFKKRKFVDIRTFYLDDNMEWQPTKKGVTVPPDLLDMVIDALNKAKQELEQEV